MPLSSSQIATLNGSFQQQYLQQQQLAQSIQPPGYNFGGMNTGAQNEGLAGRGLNHAMAIGAPAATLGLGLMGLDPISMGVRSGMAAGSVGGMGAGLAVGAGVAGVGFAGMGALSYMGNQMMSGAQQTQQFNQGMRGSYSFANIHGDHGRGFSEGDVRQIGSSVRGMAGGQIGGSFGGTASQFELGPSFNELGRLAANMGRMGLADGVRNAKEFTTKFREMMQSVKTIAEDMGTTLEEAQKTMAAMKGSGVFKNQTGVTGAIRGAAQSGGLATTEVTGMMNIGSQISRMYGGTGRQGAMGGIKAIEQVGAAQQIGAVSEEDIYNATGMTGAEGRQAFAQQNMVQTGSFLKSSKGRWLLASMAGKNGQLDPSSVSNFMSGGMGVEDTRRAAHANLGKVGRANFIRNEGRLRGAVMEEFGGLAPAMAMMGWAQGKGIDINSMGDREMLFMQRQMGLGRDEADSLVKMARKMPELLQHHRESKQEDILSREHGVRAQDSGIEGVKRRLEAAKNSVNNEMQKVGQDILGHATDVIASWGNRLAGTYEERSIEGIRDMHRTAMMGGKEGRAAAAALTGGGKFISELGGTGAGGAFAGPHEDIGQRAYREKVQALQFSSRMATAGGMDPELQRLVQAQSPGLRQAYADELAGLSGEDRMAGFKRKFGKDTELGRKFRALDERGQAAFLQQMEGTIGIKAENRLSESFQIPGLPELVGGGKYRTESERHEAMGASILGLTGSRGTAGKVGAGLGAGLGLMLLNPITAGIGGLLGKRAGEAAGGFIDELTGTAAKRRAAGSIFEDKELRGLAYGALTGAEGAADKMNMAIADITGAAGARGGFGKLSNEEAGRLGGLRAIQTTSEVMRAANAKGGVDKMTDADWAPIIKRQKELASREGRDPSSITKESILASAGGVTEMAREGRKAALEEISKQVGRTTTQEVEALQAGGIARLSTKGGVETLSLTKETEATLMKTGGAAAVQAAKQALAVQQLGMKVGKEGSTEAYDAYTAGSGKLHEMLSGMDVKSLRAFAASSAGTNAGGIASEMIMRGQSIEAGKRRKGGAAGAIAAQLGAEFGADELGGLKGLNASAAAGKIASRLGVGDDKAFITGLQESIAAANKKGGGIQSGELLQRALAGADPMTKKKLEEQAKGRQSGEEKIIDKLGEGNLFLKALVQSNDRAKAELAIIAGNTKKSEDGEK